MTPRVTANTITDEQIRELHNRFLDGTITDAIGRHLCHVALNECCVSDVGPGKDYKRYPTREECAEAKHRLAQHWNRTRR